MNEIAVSTPNNDAIVGFIERASRDPEFDVLKFGELLRMQRDVQQDQRRHAFNRAMADTQAEMQPVVRDAKNTHTGSRYAKLETIDNAMRPIYTKHGFSVRYGSAPTQLEGHIRVTCTVAHESGYFEENYLDAPLSNEGSRGGRAATTPVQTVGSAITYLRRYLLGMVFNIVLADADDDDDGEAMRRQQARTNATTSRTTEQWRVWLDRLREACATIYHDQELREVSRRQSVGDALTSSPDWVKREVNAVLADNFQRIRERAEGGTKEGEGEEEASAEEGKTGAEAIA